MIVRDRLVIAIAARHWAFAELATPESIREWEAWREDERQQEQQAGPSASPRAQERRAAGAGADARLFRGVTRRRRIVHDAAVLGDRLVCLWDPAFGQIDAGT